MARHADGGGQKTTSEIWFPPSFASLDSTSSRQAWQQGLLPRESGFANPRFPNFIVDGDMDK